jgi:folylpolyglutamate synthase/dihydropteroate synthase
MTLKLICIPLNRAFKNVISNTGLLGRWQIIADSPQLILDVGHNKEGLSFLVTELQKLEFGPPAFDHGICQREKGC